MNDVAKPRVALLGLGAMGAGMAGRLLEGGFSTTVYNRNHDKARAFVERGATVANSPREAAAGANVVISMVADDAASRAVWLGDNGALADAKPGAVLIECSTLTVRWVKELAALASQHGCEFLDAPVTGSKPQAAGGQLLFLVGGSSAAVERVNPVFAAMGRGVVHLGPAGSGALLKLINNFVCGVEAAAMAEALAWMEAGGLDRAKAAPVLTDGAPGSPLVRRTVERASQNDFVPAFSLRLMTKDLTYAMEEAARAGVKLETAATALQRFQQAIDAGLGEKDFSAVTLATKAATRSKE